MTSKQRQRELAKFGAQALAIMERDTEWSADTHEDIANEAYRLKLAENNELHEFTRTEAGYL